MALWSWGRLVIFGERFCLEFSSRSSKVVSSQLLSCSSTSSLNGKRSYSDKSGGEDNFVDGGEAAVTVDSNASGNLIEQALKEVRIQSAAPDWLPFFPGGSFWIHPDQITGKKTEKPPGPLLDPATEREILAVVMPMGWPTSTAVDEGG